MACQEISVRQGAACSGDLVRRLGGSLVYLVNGRVEAFESIDEPAGAVAADAHLRAFLAGEPIPGGPKRA